jgi:hypothetical protein
VPSHFFVPDPDIFPQLEGLKLEADDELIYVLNVDADTATDDSKHPMVSVLITDAFIGEEVKPEKKHHQAYTPMGEKKPGVVYKRKYRKAEVRIQPIATQLPEEFRCNVPYMADLGNRVHRLTSPPVPFRALYRISDIVPRSLPHLRHRPAPSTEPPAPSHDDHSTSDTVPR